MRRARRNRGVGWGIKVLVRGKVKVVNDGLGIADALLAMKTIGCGGMNS